MANSSAADKHPQARLLNPWALLPVALGVALVLWLTFNSEEVFMPSGDGEPDAVSVNYAELLLQAHPENDALRLTLIDLLVKLGDFEQARHHLARLRGKDRLATPFYEVELDILGALARPEGMDEEQTRRLLERLRKIEHVSLNDAMLERLARHALALDAPDLAARTFAELAGRDPQGRQRWLDEAARWYLASGEPLPAADIQRQLAEAQTEPAKRLAYLRQAFASLLAGERGEQAALLLDERLDALPEDESTLAWLAEGVRAAEGSQRYDLAERFIRRWRELRPEDHEALAADLRLNMAAGRIERAWEVGRELLALRPEDRTLLADLARLLDAVQGRIQVASAAESHAARLQVQLPQLGAVEVQVLHGHGQLQIEISASPGSLALLQQARGELLERLQRLHPEQPVQLTFNQQQDSGQRSRQRRYLHEEWQAE